MVGAILIRASRVLLIYPAVFRLDMRFDDLATYSFYPDHLADRVRVELNVPPELIDDPVSAMFDEVPVSVRHPLRYGGVVGRSVLYHRSIGVIEFPVLRITGDEQPEVRTVHADVMHTRCDVVRIPAFVRRTDPGVWRC